MAGKEPVRYSTEVAAIICTRLSEGETLRQICRDEGMPSPSTVIGWAKDDFGPGFAEQYARARELGYAVMAEELVEIADDGANDWTVREGREVVDHEHVTRSRLRVDTRKWLLAKALPKVYGEKIAHTGAAGGAIMIATGVLRQSDGEADEN